MAETGAPELARRPTAVGRRADSIDPRQAGATGPSVFLNPNFYAVGLLLLALMVHYAEIFDVFFAGATRAAMAVELAMLSVYLVVAFFRGHVRAILGVLLFLAYLIAQSFLFAAHAGVPANPNALIGYAGILLVLVLYESRLSLRTILSMLAVICALYLLLYALLWQAVAHYTGTERMNAVLAGDAGRATRAFLSGPLALFVLFAGLDRLRRAPVSACLLLALAGYAIYAAQSRQFMATTAVLAVCALVGYSAHLRRPVAYMLVSISLFLCLANLYGFVDEGWNPYRLIAFDDSGFARQLEYADGLRVASPHLWTGVGVEPSLEALQAYVQPKRPFFPSDLGISGTVFNFGLPFTLLLLALICISMVTIPNAAAREQPFSMALYWTTQACAFGSYFSISVLGGAGMIFFGMTIFLWLRGGFYEPLYGRWQLRPAVRATLTT